ncbi:hypothetical protein KC345_g143 [Hortaea werneckii]|nr:hypothetical protein KC345_g143 [Hortaea werneckii]
MSQVCLRPEVEIDCLVCKLCRVHPVTLGQSGIFGGCSVAGSGVGAGATLCCSISSPAASTSLGLSAYAVRCLCARVWQIRAKHLGLVEMPTLPDEYQKVSQRPARIARVGGGISEADESVLGFCVVEEAILRQVWTVSTRGSVSFGVNLCTPFSTGFPSGASNFHCGSEYCAEGAYCLVNLPKLLERVEISDLSFSSVVTLRALAPGYLRTRLKSGQRRGSACTEHLTRRTVELVMIDLELGEGRVEGELDVGGPRRVLERMHGRRAGRHVRYAVRYETCAVVVDQGRDRSEWE